MIHIIRKMSTSQEGPVARSIRAKLQNYFSPIHLEVVCESYLHNVPKGSEKHFRVQVVSETFEGCSVIQRHRMVNACLADELSGGVHALRIDAIPPSRWIGQKTHESPSCRGGGGL